MSRLTSWQGGPIRERSGQTAENLDGILRRIDGKGYKAYRDLVGEYAFDNYSFLIDHVQADPFAPPSRVRVAVPLPETKIPKEAYSTPARNVGLCDFLIRIFHQSLHEIVKKRRGTGRSGMIYIDTPGQEILARTAVVMKNGMLEARFAMGLPAMGRRIAARAAREMMFDEVPAIVKKSLIYSNPDSKRLFNHIQVNEDAEYLRRSLPEQGLIAFVADESILPRASGVDNRPMQGSNVVTFQSPPSLRVSFHLPNRGEITGMGIRRGITLIVGGGFHGKSTLLNALERGIYNHIPGDGREFVVSSPNAVKIRAEDGRRVEKVDISPFISNLPFGRDTRQFCTDDASGSTSQAANIMESLEMGADVLLIDEDTSATNFMIRDHRMQELVAKEKEPITPFIDRAAQIFSELGVSTILVIGGSGDYFDIAHTVICMEEYNPHDCTEKAREIAGIYGAERAREGSPQFGPFRNRIPLAGSISPRKGRHDAKISKKGLFSISFGVHTIDLSAMEQLVDESQTAAIGEAIYYATRYLNGKTTISEAISCVCSDISDQGLDILGRMGSRDYAQFRPLDMAGAMNRLRSLEVVQRTDTPLDITPTDT